jgi:hypothetical protein
MAALACALLAVTLLGAPPASAKPQLKFIFMKARVVADGIVTPGQQETISVSNLPPKSPIDVFIEPPPTTPQCGEFYFCDVVGVPPAPGTPLFRTNGKGRATLTFVMPSSYFVETDPFHPRMGTEVHWMNGQAVHIDVQGRKRTKRVRTDSFGFARAVVQLSA